MFINYLFLSVIITLLVFIISTFFMENKFNEVSESPFECGFEPISFSRIPFSMQFFSITIVFLIFDLEIIIILPLASSYENPWIISTILSLIVIILLVGLIVEWYDGALNWTF